MYKVMIVDDDSTVYHVVKKIIPWEKYLMSVEAYAPNGEKAIEYLIQNSVDVILVDLDGEFTVNRRPPEEEAAMPPAERDGEGEKN